MIGRIAGALLLLASAPARATPVPLAAPHPRLFVLTDIGNEPDDQMSLVRLLLYSNEIDIEGIGAVTSVWQRAVVHPEIAHRVIAAYGQVLPNLRRNAAGWPDAEALGARVAPGVAAYGLAAMDPAHPSPAALALVAAARRDDGRPLWVSLWGGANTLAEALAHARATLPPAELEAVVARLRVYAISDQDDAGAWIRREFPKLFWVGTPSTQDGAEYARATWTGISGEDFYRNGPCASAIQQSDAFCRDGKGANVGLVTNDWLDKNIRAKGPLGAAYPKFLFIMEGDTPSYLGLIPNGLASSTNPGWGGWGGRYLLRQPFGETHKIWTQGGDSFMRVTSADTVDGVTSDQATIWRWRESYQNDFAARMDWTMLPFARANHPPLVVVDGAGGQAPLTYRLGTGASVTPDASASRDPNGNPLSYHWFAYDEAGFDGQAPNPEISIAHADSPRPTITVRRRCAKAWLDLPQLTCPATRTAHVILAVTNEPAGANRGTLPITRYRRILIEVHDDR